ncbi:MAG: tRNA-queuosine alpha-mannosyltransferase domain-containing protein [Phycisphaerales bacterium]
MVRILAFESFDGGSHLQFRETLTKYSVHDWSWITRPAREWKWRMATSALEMASEAISRDLQTPDCIFTTSLTDAAALRASLPNGWRDIPLVLYMHENQIAYPSRDKRDSSFAFTNLQSVLTADLTIFNSKWNLDSFIDGMESLLAKSKDSTLTDIGERVRSNSAVAWVPVEFLIEKQSTKNTDDDCIRVVWPHRWEHDKGPDRLLELAREHTTKLNLRWIILGEQFSEIPESLKIFQDEFQDRIDHMGYVESKAEYWNWLHKADWVLSTADHEFFGIAVVESLFAGCLPWLPEKLSYPELLPACARGLTPATQIDSPEDITKEIQDHLYMAQAIPASKRIDMLISNTII